VLIDWGLKVITVYQADLTPLGGTLYELDLNWFRLQLKDFEDDAGGMPYPRTHRHNTEVTISGVTYARTVEIINGYTVTFEDVGPHYTVTCTGANHNIVDVLNFNSVNLLINNSAGLINAGGGGGGLTQQQVRDAMTLTSTTGKPSVDDKLDKNYQVGVAAL
jgi:hypothetical protein